MTPTADLMRLVEKWRAGADDLEMQTPPGACDTIVRTYRKCADELQALSALGEAQYPEDSDVSVSDDGTLHVDLRRDGSGKRQLSILVTKDGAVKFAVYCEGRRYHGSVNDPNFITALADYSALGEARVGGEAMPCLFGEPDPDGRNEPQTPEQLADWLDAKYRRHGEVEDKNAAIMLRHFAALATPAQPKASASQVFGKVGELLFGDAPVEQSKASEVMRCCPKADAITPVVVCAECAENDRLLREAVYGHPKASEGDAVSLLREVCQELDGVGCGACVGSDAPMEDLHGRIAAHLLGKASEGKVGGDAVDAVMGSRADAEANLLSVWRDYCATQQPAIVPAGRKAERQREAVRNETRNRMVQAGALLAWHINATLTAPGADDGQ